MSTSRSSPGADHDVELLDETIADANDLPVEVRRVIAGLIVRLHDNAHMGEVMDDRPPRILRGCRKVRFDLAEHRGKPRFRLVYRNEPADGAVATVLVLAIAPRDRMIAYVRAAARLRRRISEEGRA